MDVNELKAAFERVGTATESAAKSSEAMANAIKACDAEVTQSVYLGKAREEVLHEKPWLRKGKRKW